MTKVVAVLAGELSAMGYSVTVLDTDPQKSLLGWANLGTGLLKRITSAVETEHPERFKQAVEAAKKSVDIVLIDTPPGLADPALLAALLADIVLLPAGPSPLDIMAARDGAPLIRFVPSKMIPRSGLSRRTYRRL
jgi:chromosome partitioning protein